MNNVIHDSRLAHRARMRGFLEQSLTEHRKLVTCECHGVAADRCPARGPLGFLRRIFSEWTAGVGRP